MSITIRSLLAGAALALLAPAVQAQEVTLRLAHVLSPSEPMHLASERYAELVRERSGGRVAIEVFPSGQLGSNPDLYEQVRMGVPVIQISDPGYLSDFVADFGVLNGPYLLDDPADFQKLIDSDWYAGIVEQIAEEHRIRVLSLNWLFGSRHVIANQPVRTLADFENLSIRVPPNVMWIETFQALGARGTALAWPEVYSGLANRVIDAAEAPLSSLYGSKLYESADTISMTGHFTAFTGPIINEDLFQAMPEDLQAILTEAAAEAGVYMADLVNAQQGEFRANLEAQGVTFVDDVDVEAFRTATAAVYQAFPAWSEGLHDRIRALLDE
jgi:tripartite ATP-independent transporter DctP family solute receptor